MHATEPLPPVDDSDAQPSLWQELVAGSAGPVIKTAISIGLAPLAAGLALLASYLLAMCGIGNRSWSPEYTIPDDGLVALTMVAAGLAYLAAVAWIWTRNRPKHGWLWGAALLTVGIGAVTIVLCMAAEANVRGADEIVIGGLACLGIAAVVLVWVQAARRYRRAVPVRDRRDGALDVRCPTCGYRMVGLHESRCPECGTGYTLDELLGRQHFISGAHRQRAGFGIAQPASHATPPPPPPPPPPAPQPQVGSAAAGAG